MNIGKAERDMREVFIIGRIEHAEQKLESINIELMACLSEVGPLKWPNGWRGKDGRRLPNPMDRFISHIAISESGCWDWTGTIANNGYGHFGFDGRLVLAHRWIMNAFYGLKGPPFVIDHLCRNRKCVNPLHLEEVTQSTNVVRGDSRNATKERIRTKTHCKHGHRWSEDNIYVSPSGQRSCRACNAQRKNEWEKSRRLEI